MNMQYHPETDMLYLYFESHVPNIQTRSKHPEIFKFVAKADKTKTIGFEIERVSKNINYALAHLDLTSKQKLALCLYYLRARSNKTQKEFAHILSVSGSTYKKLEKGEHNINFDTIENIFVQFSNETIFEKVFLKTG
jgi:DNA-binding XRE family transcriptional regulator